MQQFTLTVQYLPQVQGDAVLQWNQIALNTILLTATDTVQASRELAMESIAISDSIAAIEGTQAFLRTPPRPLTPRNQQRSMRLRFPCSMRSIPAKPASLNTQYQASLAQLASGQGTSDGIALGQAVANQVLALRANFYLAPTPWLTPREGKIPASGVRQGRISGWRSIRNLPASLRS